MKASRSLFLLLIASLTGISCDRNNPIEADDPPLSGRLILDCPSLQINENEMAMRFVNDTEYDIDAVRVSQFAKWPSWDRDYEFTLWPSTLSCYEILPINHERFGTRYSYEWLFVSPVGLSVRPFITRPFDFDSAQYTYFYKIRPYIWPMIRDRTLYLDNSDSLSIWVRVINDSAADFREVELDSYDFGDVRSGDSTAYFDVDRFRTGYSASLIAGPDTLWFFPDHDSPKQSNGYYTIRIDTIQTWRLREISKVVRDS